MIEEQGYDSDIVDEEEVARLYESVYYNDVPGMENFSLPQGSNSLTVANILHQSLIPENLKESRTDFGEHNSGVSDGDGQSGSSPNDCVNLSTQYLSENTHCNQEDYEALTLLITGQTPQSVLDKAERRLRLFKMKKCTALKFVRSSHSDDSDSDQISSSSLSGKSSGESALCDIVIGVKNCTSDDLRHNHKYIPEEFKNLPSDPKYWSIDSEGFYNSKKGFDFNRNKEFTCYCCGQKGHSHYRCPKACCSLCLQFGHNSKNCKRVYQIRRAKCPRCKQMGHEESTCPDVWRQYRYTTKPGPPVRKPTSRDDRKEDRRSLSRNFGPIPICKYDDHDVYAIARDNSTLQQQQQQTDGELKSAQKTRTFDEPVYLSFNGRVSSSAPVQNTPEALARGAKRKRKFNEGMKQRRRLSVPSPSAPTVNTKKMKAKRKSSCTVHQRRHRSGPTSSIPVSAENDKLSERFHRNSLPAHVLESSSSSRTPNHFSQSFGDSRFNPSNRWRNRKSACFAHNHTSLENTRTQGSFSRNFNRGPPAKRSGLLKRKNPGHDYRRRKSSQSNSSPGKLPNLFNSPYLKLVGGYSKSKSACRRP